MIEIHLQLDSHYSLHVMGKEINLDKIGIQKNYSMTSESIKLLFEIIAQLRYCFGVNTLSEHNLPYFEEHVCIDGDENSEQIHYRSKTCAKVLPFKNSNIASSCCINCKKLKTRISLKEPKCDINEEDNNDSSSISLSDNDVMLGKSDHNDLSEILKTIFPEYPLKMQTFLMSQKMALERNRFGLWWSEDIIRLCLTLYCRSPRGYSELRSCNFVILPSQNLLRRYKNSVIQEAGINKEMLQWMANIIFG